MATNYQKVLASNIRAERGRAGISQQELARRMRVLGFDAWLHQTVGNVERGKRRVTAEEMLGLGLAMKTSIGQLMDPSPNDQFIELPSGQVITVETAHNSVMGYNDNMVLWLEDGTPQFLSPPPRTFPDRQRGPRSAWAEEVGR